MWDKIKTFLNHERYQTIAIVLVVGLLIWFIGCQSKVKSIVDPARNVTRPQLHAEVEYFLATAETKFADLDKQDEFKQLLLNNAIVFSQTGTINPYAILVTFAGIWGAGATADNIRKRKALKNALTDKTTEPDKNG